MSPDHLSAFALAIIATGGPPAYMDLVGFKPDLAFAHRSAERVAASAKTVRQLSPAAGSYLSESSYFNADWKHAYWGENYPRLSGVKARCDPAGLFFVHHGVGSDGWSADGFDRLGSGFDLGPGSTPRSEVRSADNRRAGAPRREPATWGD